MLKLVVCYLRLFRSFYWHAEFTKYFLYDEVLQGANHYPPLNYFQKDVFWEKIVFVASKLFQDYRSFRLGKAR